MAKTFRDMVSEAKQQVEVISPEEAQRRINENPNALVVDVREPDDRAANGAIPGSVNIPLGVLPLRADTQLAEQFRDARLQDRSTPVITTCGGGGQAALAAKMLKEMGFSNVATIDTGTNGWKGAGLPTE
jgi:rhodanese-related sulfurtransferase